MILEENKSFSDAFLKAVYTFFFLLLYGMIFAQSVSNLELDNGFQNIHFIDDIDSARGFISIFKDIDIDNGKYDFAMYESQYSYNGTGHKEFAGSEVKKIFLSTTQGYISEIRVICEHDSSLVSALTQMYGQPVSKFKNSLVEDKKAERCFAVWQSVKIRLIYTAKKYFNKKDSDKAEIPDYIYLRFTLLDPEKAIREKYLK